MGGRTLQAEPAGLSPALPGTISASLRDPTGLDLAEILCLSRRPRVSRKIDVQTVT